MVTEKLFVAASILYGVATYFYYEKLRRTMRTAIVSNLLKGGWKALTNDFR